MISRILMAVALALTAVTNFAPTAAAEESTVTVTIRNHKFEPAAVQAPAGEKIKLIIKNTDAADERFESVELRRKKIVPGGGDAVVYVGPLQPGRYDFVGNFNPKSARGQLVVK